MRLIAFRSNRHSQNGEDGVIEEIFRRLGILDKKGIVVEFGAWDGIHLSNTFNLVENFGYSAIYIEGDTEKFHALTETAKKFSNIHPIFTMLSRCPTEKSTTLDQVLETEGIGEVAILSIDIDSYDLEIWASSCVNAKVVVIEINSSIEPGIIRWHNPPKNTGNSFSATLEVATFKSYTLACHTGNMIFVRNDLVEFLELDELDLKYPERLFLPDWVGIKPSWKERLLLKLTRLPPSVKTRVRSLCGMKKMDYGS